eukprot:CAMPEP_0172532788 /NCGR_PEP_ID=MMETSP1067-20121228/5708_1 /TAXON_ID=265564 ORGANISM="Thalassiosira punctigera, Strain Tpunct2005C2" /NCGR_SAMPLE_ID=MMETSP1067 /ASSEMBLY_ACC=CAM_ASM_000444 /LENGTH=375 /DNA_ID=CAMNT_0013317341 /DNA_START=172 /DNA_END=1299 /DNA_ORIENTATION=+
MRQGCKRLHLAATAASALVLVAASHSPSTVHAAVGAGLRSGPLSPQHEVHENHDRELLPNSSDSVADDEETPMPEERALAGSDYENAVRIYPFTTDLLDVHFPFGIKDANRLCGVASSHIAGFLENVENVGLYCGKYKQHVGMELRWVLRMEGDVTFTEPPNDEKVTKAIHQAFEAPNKELFLEHVYPKYEAVWEKRQFDDERANRLRRGRGGRKPVKKKKKKKKNKKKGKKKQQGKMKPNSGGGRGKENDNVMGYVSGSQSSGVGSKSEGYEIINGNIHVYVDGKGGGGGGGGGGMDKPEKNEPQMQQHSSGLRKPQNKPGNNPGGFKPQSQSNGNINVMGYVSGLQGKDKDKPQGYEIKNGDIHVNVKGRGQG